MRAIGCAFVLVLLCGSVGLAQEERVVGAWTVIRDVDLITDEDSSYIYSVAFDGPSAARAAGPTVMCSTSGSSGVLVVFMIDRYMGSGDTAEVVYRIDGGPPVSMEWWLLGGDVVAPPPGDMDRVLRDWVDSSTLVFRASTRLSTYTFQADVAGLRAALVELRCYRGPLR